MPFQLTRAVGGPLTRNVTDAAVLLDVLAGVDPADPATKEAEGQIPASYTAFLDPEGLRGARIGVFRELINNEGNTEGDILALVNEAIVDLEAAGAEIVDPAPTLAAAQLYFASRIQLIQFNTFEYCMNRYLEGLGSRAPVSTVRDIMEREVALGHSQVAMRAYGNWLRGDVRPEEDPQYPTILRLEAELRSAVLEAMDAENLDVLLYPTNYRGPQEAGDRFGSVPITSLAPSIQFPAITVPAGVSRDGVSVGIEFLGRRFSEPTLIRIAYAYEQATRHRVPPASTPLLPSFLRGECNGDGDVNLADALCSLRWLFSAGSTPDCLAALNINGDASLNLADPIALLTSLFGDGDSPGELFSGCTLGTLAVDHEFGCQTPQTSCE